MALSNHFSFLSFWRRALRSFFFIRLLAFRLSADVPFCSVCMPSIGLVDLADSAVSCISAVAPVSLVCVPSIGLVDLTDSAFCVVLGLVPSQQAPMNCFDHLPSSPSEVQSQCIHFLRWLHFTDHSFLSLILIPHTVHSYPFFGPGLTSMSWCSLIRINSDLCLGPGLVTNACSFPHQSAILLGLKVEVCLTVLLTLKTPPGPNPPLVGLFFARALRHSALFPNSPLPNLTHHKFQVLLRHRGQSLSHQSLKSGRGVAQAKGHPLPLVQPQFTCEFGLFSVLLPQRDLPEGRTQVQCGEELGVAKFREALVYSRYRIRIFHCHCIQVKKVATEPKLPPFLLGHDYPASPRRFRGFYHVVFEQHFFLRSTSFPYMRRHSSCAFPMRNGPLF